MTGELLMIFHFAILENQSILQNQVANLENRPLYTFPFYHLIFDQNVAEQLCKSFMKLTRHSVTPSLFPMFRLDYVDLIYDQKSSCFEDCLGR